MLESHQRFAAFEQVCAFCGFFFFSSRRRHTRFDCDWSSDVCSSDLDAIVADGAVALEGGTGAARPWESLEPSLLGAGTIALALLVWELVPHLLTLSPGMELFFTTPTRIADRKSTRLNSSHSQISYAVF